MTSFGSMYDPQLIPLIMSLTYVDDVSSNSIAISSLVDSESSLMMITVGFTTSIWKSIDESESSITPSALNSGGSTPLFGVDVKIRSLSLTSMLNDMLEGEVIKREFVTSDFVTAEHKFLPYSF